MNILIIDDSVADAALLSHALLSHSSSVSVAAITSGKEGLAAINQSTRPFDFVFLDLHLSQEHGWDILLQIRETLPSARLKVVMTSTEASEEFIVESKKLGADAFLAKTLDFTQFRQEVARVYQELAIKHAALRMAA